LKYACFSYVSAWANSTLFLRDDKSHTAFYIF